MANARETRRRQVVVSVTPLRVEADSRTFKQAASVARLGYHSIVVESGSSRLERTSLPFELRSVVDGTSHPRAENGGVRRGETSGGRALRRKGRTIGRSVGRLMRSTASLVRAGGHGVAAVLLRFPGGSAVHGCLHLVGRRMRRYLQECLISEPAQFARHIAKYIKLYLILPLRTMPRARLYYLHAFYQFPAVYVMCVFSRARFVYDAHDFYSQLEDDESISHYWRYWVLPWEKAVERICVRRAAAVVTVNEGIADLMRERFGCHPVVIRNAHDVRLDRQVERTIREVAGVERDVFLLVSVGNWKPGMAIEECFAALEALPQHYHLAFLGAGFPSYDEDLDARRLRGRVHLLPPVAPDEVVPYIRTADAAIVLYYAKSLDYQFSLPNRFFQPVAAGVPLLYPALPEIRRLADRHGVGLPIDSRDPGTVAEALRRLGEDSTLRDHIRRNLLEAGKVLSWEREEAELGRLLESLLGAPGAVRRGGRFLSRVRRH